MPEDFDIISDLNGQAPDAVPYDNGLRPEQVPARGTEPQPQDAVVDRGAEKPESTRDIITKAYKAAIDPNAPAQEPAAPEVKLAPDGTQAVPELIKVGDRWHNKDGTFASAEAVAAYNAALPPEAPKADAPPAPFFNMLTPLEQQQFTSLPTETRQFVERTMQGVMQREQQFAEYGTLEQQLIGPRREAWAQGGMSPLVALNNLLNLSDMAGQDPARFVLWFADQHRLDLDQILDDRDAAQQKNPQDPALSGLQQEIAQLRNTITGFVNTSVQTEHDANLKTVQDFALEKGSDGNLAYPYFAEVANTMMQFVPSIKQQQPQLSGKQVLEAAYEFACYRTPEVRAKMQQASQEAATAAAAAKALKAREAGSSINGGPNSGDRNAPDNPNRSIRDTIKDAYNAQIN